MQPLHCARLPDI